MTKPQTDEKRLRAALLALGTPDYNRLRDELIERLGYDAFRDLQNKVFKQIGTIEAEAKESLTKWHGLYPTTEEGPHNN